MRTGDLPAPPMVVPTTSGGAVLSALVYRLQTCLRGVHEMEVKRTVSHILFVVILSLAMQSIAYPSPYQGSTGHGRDIKSILGNKDLDELYKLISTTVDQELPRIMKEKFGTNPGYNHRIFGHWGFEGAIPFDVEPYREPLSKYPKEELIRIWRETVNRLTLRAQQITGLPPRQAKGLVGLIYNIHLLGDLKPDPKTNKIIAPLRHLIPERMNQEIIKNLHRMYGNNSSMVRMISEELNSLKNVKDPQKYAQMVLEILKKHNLGRNLSAIILRVGEQLSTSAKPTDMDSKEPLKNVENEAPQKASRSSEANNRPDVKKENPDSKIRQAKERSEPEMKMKNSSKFTKLIKGVFRCSAFISIMVSGYTMTAEIYHAKMAGKEIHPSRLILRAFVGFAGGLAGGFLLGVALALLFCWFHPAAVTASIIGALIGGVLGASGAEWLFELIMPNRGLGYIILDVLIGGVFGSTIGTVVGLIRGLYKTPPIEIAGFWRTLWEILTFPFTLLESCLTGAIWGLVLGGCAGSTLFFVMFAVM